MPSAGSARLRTWFGRVVEPWAAQKVGGHARLRIVTLLAAVLALQSADIATVGAVAAPLSADLGLTNTDIGLLVSLSTLIGAVATLPMGVLADRVNRVRLLTGAIVVWSVAEGLSGVATSFTMLLLTRLALGAVIATATPVVSSLIGDYFPGRDRARIFGYVLAGELVGTGAGFAVSGTVAGLISWRASFFLLAGGGLVLGWALYRLLAEPARGTHAVAEDEQDRGGHVADEVRRSAVQPDSALLQARDPEHMSVWAAVVYVMRIRTNLVLIVASALTYFFFTGLQTFAVQYLTERFGVPQSVASILLVVIGAGAVGGVLISPRIADWLIGRGVVYGRVLVAGVALLLIVVLGVPSLLIDSLLIAAVLLFFAAAAYGATNPPLDSARLDIMHHQLWGRAEAVRTVLRSLFTAAAPLTFGFASTRIGGDHGQGLGRTFLIMLAPVLAAALLLLVRGVRTYPRDVATAEAFERLTSGRSSDSESRADDSP